jgi:hypothetical protein
MIGHQIQRNLGILRPDFPNVLVDHLPRSSRWFVAPKVVLEHIDVEDSTVGDVNITIVKKRLKRGQPLVNEVDDIVRNALVLL